MLLKLHNELKGGFMVVGEGLGEREGYLVFLRAWN